MSRPLTAVTGAAGFIGGHLVRRLSTVGHAVRALDTHAPTGALRELPNVTWTTADLRDAGAVRSLVEDADLVFHLASVHLEVGASETAFIEVNVDATRSLVRACRDGGVRRLIHTSSVGIYGHVANPPATEGSPKKPETPYERSKLAGELAVLEEADKSGPGTVVLRPAWVYGPGCPRTAKLFRALRKRRFFYVGDGRNLRHPLYVDDLLDAYLLAADAADACVGRPYIIAGPRAMPLREMVDTFASVAGAPAPRLRLPRTAVVPLAFGAELAFRFLDRNPPISRRTLAFFENDNSFDTSAAERDLGFQAHVDLEEGVRRTVRVTEAYDGGPPPPRVAVGRGSS